MKLRPLLLIVIVLTWFTIRCGATTVGTEIIECAACGRHYAEVTYLSWNSWLMPKGPPEPSAICPYCLFAWHREAPKKLSVEQRTVVRGAIVAYPNTLRPKTRERLHSCLDDGRVEPVVKDLQALCDRALVVANHGRSPSESWWISRHERENTETRDEKHVLRAQLPRMITALEHKKLLVPPRKSEMAALFTTAELIEDGHMPAAKFFLLWALSASEKQVSHCSLAVRLNLKALHSLPRAAWPITDFNSARVPFIADVLSYAHSGGKLPRSMRRQLAKREWDDLSELVAGLCGIRRDRQIVKLLAGRLRNSFDPGLENVASAFYESAGVPGDVGLLSSYARRLQPERDFYEGLVRQNVERVILKIRLRCLFAATPPTSGNSRLTPDPRQP